MAGDVWEAVGALGSAGVPGDASLERGSVGVSDGSKAIGAMGSTGLAAGA